MPPKHLEPLGATRRGAARPESTRPLLARWSYLAQSSRSDHSTNRIAKWTLFIALAAGPLPFGSRNPAIIAFWCCLLGLGLLFASPRDLRRPHFLMLAAIAVVVAGYAFVLHEQLAVHPWLAPFNPIWKQAVKLVDLPIVSAATIIHDQPFYAIGAPLAAVLALILGLVVGTNRANAHQVIRVMAWAGVVYACYGIFSLFVAPNMLLWEEKTAQVGSLSATFNNRNTAATYFGSCSVVWLVLLMLSVRGQLPRGPIVWRTAPRYFLTDTPLTLVTNFVAWFVCLIALFMTSSRGGVLVSLICLLGAFMVFFRRNMPKATHLILALIVASTVILLLFQIVGGATGHRLQTQGLDDEGRLSVYRSTLQLIRANPWFGTGLGTFAWAFPHYRAGDISTYGVWDRAHSTPLELASEVGLPLTALIAAAWLAALAILVKALAASRRHAAIPLAVLGVCFIALLHSAIDFSLQIPGYAIVVFALLGVGLAQAFGNYEKPGFNAANRTSLGKASVSSSRINSLTLFP